MVVAVDIYAGNRVNLLKKYDYTYASDVNAHALMVDGGLGAGVTRAGG